MKIAMMGSGGVGGYFGARLAMSGQEVTFIARGAHAEAMRARGLTLRSDAGEENLSPARVVPAPDQAGVQDLIVVAVKLWDTEQVAQSLAPMVGPQTAVVSLQNGVDKDEVLARILGPAHVLGGVTYISAVIAEPGVIALTGKLARVLLGELDGARSPRLAAIHQAFTGASIQCALSDRDPPRHLEEVRLLELLQRPDRADPDADWQDPRAPDHARVPPRGAARGDRGGPRRRGRARPRLRRDPAAQLRFTRPRDALVDGAGFLRGHRLELPWLSGAVVRRGEQHGVPVPVHRAIHAGLVLHQEGHP